MMKSIAMYRQGDVLLVRVDEPNFLHRHTRGNTKLVEPKMDSVILAYGEATGHAHVLERDKVKPLLPSYEGRSVDKTAWDSGAERFIQVLEKTSLRHLDLPRDAKPTGEHADVPLEPGLYKVVRQREWTDEMARYVSD